MSDCEWFVQVAHIKRATVSDLLRSLMINERMSGSLKIFWLKSYFWYVLYTFFYLKNKRFAHSLFFNEVCEGIAQVAHQKWVTMSNSLRTMSESLRSLTKNEQMSKSLIFSQKTSDLLRKLMSEFPALQKLYKSIIFNYIPKLQHRQ